MGHAHRYFRFQTDKRLLANKPHTLVAQKEQKRTVVMDAAIPDDSNIRRKKLEKIKKHHKIKESLEQTRRAKTTVLPVVEGVLKALSTKLSVWLQQTAGVISESQKTPVLDAA